MKNAYECEVRLLNYDFDSLLAKIKALGGEKKLEYDFDDYYFEPKNSTWNTSKNIRVRQWLKPNRPTAIYFSKNTTETIDCIAFKKSVYADGKIKLFEGDLKTCFSILDDLEYIKTITLEKRNGQVWNLPNLNFEIILEHVSDFGWSGELEVSGLEQKKTKQEIERIVQLLELTQEQISFKSMSELFLEKQISL
ncbi:MAG: hypothetical protein GW762_02540 [Candidatus Pacebacteria bacterium]|nr:hypothetical protein [Candidatus Paceibacterota bacterium]PIR64113.1 MAG: hypothetical protein COU64_01030 [Candidatus Pacebacteria bacterium CG10_big_fil_rev_8_21_14_0_10_40_26]PIZ78465.1 MAG: hypothetical protein COY01_04410 [Candidatus Pacebacteria bacterium CG_4_10_14_0_2_um_filter_40_20]PJA69315.1 MAG: hypothetical protein CO156_00295 [Candidatus Pacebacteria bacterium CG_4_9_14_3_um_filter_40_12]PJC41998.1 MAG: hypothetical protein CO041_01850 [Candidatus Pacebacteria bacterium CG_4_9_